MILKTDCSTCESCEDTLGGLNSKLISIADKSLYNARFELNREVDYALFRLLMFYKGVLEDICSDESCDCYYVVPLNYTGESNTCLTIGKGLRTLVTQSDLDYKLGDRARFSSRDLCSYMEGMVIEYLGTSLTIEVDLTQGTGERCCWDISKVAPCTPVPHRCGDTCADPCPNTGISGTVINHCICGCCPPLNVVCNVKPFEKKKNSAKALTKENIIERIKILTA